MTGYLEKRVGPQPTAYSAGRGQYALEGRSALLPGSRGQAGVMRLLARGLSRTLLTTIDVKALHEIHRLASLLEVYKGSPFGDISTRQIHLHPVRLEAKARPVLFWKSACSPGLGLTTSRWTLLVIKRYVMHYPHKVNSSLPYKKKFDTFGV